MAKNTEYKKAFTLVELMLAVAFLGTLLLSIAMLTMQLINIYTKGATMRAINSTGSSMMRDIRSAILSSRSYPSNLDTEKEKYFWRDNSSAGGKASDSRYGMFCTGSYTYVWNYRDAMKDFRSSTGSDWMEIRSDESSTQRPYAFARIKDIDCDEFEEAVKNGSTVVSVDKDDDLSVLLDGKESGDGTDLVLYDFSTISATRSGLTDKGLYDISFVLGTMRGEIDVKSSSNYCKQNSSGSSDTYGDVGLNYCSVNRFEFIVRQSGMKTLKD